MVVENGNIVIVSAEGRDTVRNIEHFQFLDGTIDLNDGNPLVDDLFYFARNKDVWDAQIDADAHYNAIGWKEGRDPNPEFSTKGYLSANADVKAAGINPLDHYHQSGWLEGRDPSAVLRYRALSAEKSGRRGGAYRSAGALSGSPAGPRGARYPRRSATVS